MSTAIIVSREAKPGKEAEVAELFNQAKAGVSSEPGTLRFDVWNSKANPTKFYLNLVFRDDAAVQAHFAGDVFTNIKPKVDKLCVEVGQPDICSPVTKMD